MAIRLRLKEIRERELLTQQELADRMGTSKANVSRIESAGQAPRPSTIRRLATALGVEVTELVVYTADEENGGPGKP